MEHYRIQRAGKPPIEFRGKVVAESCTDRTDKAHRWHELTCYRTQGGILVCKVEHFTKWEGEEGMCRAEAFKQPHELATWLEKYDPQEDFRGPPPNPMKTAQREYALHDLRVRWQIAIGELLAQLPDAAEKVD